MKLSSWFAALLSLFSSTLFTGCDLVNLPEIKPGVTTLAEVRTRMGEPGFIHWNEDGTATWEYSRQPSGVDCYMISFDTAQVVSKLEQVLVDAQYARVQPGLSKDDVRRLLGQPARRTMFDNLNEEIWEWKIRGDLPTDETYFMVHFDLTHGAVKKSGKRIQHRA